MAVLILVWLALGNECVLWGPFVILDVSFWLVGDVRNDDVLGQDSATGMGYPDLADSFREGELSIRLVQTFNKASDSFQHVDKTLVRLDL
jgi:hypothetical protein